MSAPVPSFSRPRTGPDTEKGRESTGRLYDIQGYSVQDGPGIRTTAFLKGCPLRCPWCHSPESQLYKKQLSWMAVRCLGVDVCGTRCIDACRKNAVELGKVRENPADGAKIRMIHVKRELCDDCGECAERCFAGALYLCGRDYTAGELTERLLRDKSYYEMSGGGVTISGGEPLTQIDFVESVLRRLKENGVHTALDTTGFAKWEVLERTVPYTDLYLYDLKHMDSLMHEAVVKVPNEPILENVRALAARGKKLQIRIPVIPRFNADEDNIRATAALCAELGEAVTMVQLLPYHNWGVSKYLRISDEPVVEAVPPSDEYMAKLKDIVSAYGLPVTIH